jgi:hypothetical protein
MCLLHVFPVLPHPTPIVDRSATTLRNRWPRTGTRAAMLKIALCSWTLLESLGIVDSSAYCILG